MTRITKKRKDGFYELAPNKEIYGEENGVRLVQIVGQLEDIREKHNIDLFNALSILDNGIWVRLGDAIIHIKPTLGFRDNNYYFEFDYFIYLPEDYGKTWALTKEELEK